MQQPLQRPMWNSRQGRNFRRRSRRRCGGGLRLLFLPDDRRYQERDTGGDQQFNYIHRNVVDRQQAGNTGHAVGRRAQARQGSEQRADRAADHARDKGFHEPEVHTEDGRFRDAQGGGQGGRQGYGLEFRVAALDCDGKAGAELCEVRGGRDGHPDVQAECA